MVPIRKGLSSILREVMVFLYLEPMSLHWEYSVGCSPPSTRKASWAEKHSVTEGPVMCEGRGDEFLQCGGKKGQAVFQPCHGRNIEGRAVLFQEMCDESLRGKGYKSIPRLTDSE